MPLIPFPNVPNVPGVPAIPRANTGANRTTTALLGAVNGILWSALQSEARWGIYDKKGKPLADPSNITGLAKTISSSLGMGPTQSTLSISYNRDIRVSDFPVEKGSFASYNRVQMPSEIVVQIAFQGSESERTAFLQAIDKASISTDLYDVAMPEGNLSNYSITGFSYERSAQRGATLLIFNISLKKIRQVTSKYTTATKSPSAASPDNAGKVQATTPSASTLTSVAKQVPSLASSAKNQIASMVK